ncbi:MAG: ABC transporter ATP-binding protein [Puniceicoccaceae bacterium]
MAGTEKSKVSDFLRKAYFLARPYGRKRLIFVFIVILAQGLFQVIGVTSIFPFLALAANPAAFKDSSVGHILLNALPPLSDARLIFFAGLFALIMLLLSNALMMAGEIVRTRYAHGYAHWLRLRLLDRMLQNSYGYFLNTNTGELLKKTTGDVYAYVSGVLSPLLEGVARGITSIFLILTLVLVNPGFAIGAAIALGIFYSLIYKILRNRRENTSRSMKLANRGAMREAQQLLGGIKPIKVHGVEQVFLNRYAQHSAIQATLQKWFPIYQNAPRYLIEPLAFGAIVIFVLLLSIQRQDFSSFIPMLGVMAMAGYRLIPNFQLFYGSATQITLMMHSMEEVYDEFMTAEEPDTLELIARRPANVNQLEWSNAIRLEKITFQYPSTKSPVINGLSLKIPKNSFIAFVGETGSGKSTLVDILLGLHRPQSGRIMIDELELARDNMRPWRASIGYVPQEIFLLDDTIAANVAFGLEAKAIDEEQLRTVTEVAQIREFIESELPDGFQSRVGERGVRLSGGQRQRIGLARALYHKPALLVLDEATSALDNATESALMEAIEALYGQMTLVVIAHRLTTIRRADQIFLLKDGGVERQGTFEELGFGDRVELT